MNDHRSKELEELEALLAIAREHDFDAMLVEEGSFRIELVRREALPMMAAAPLVAAAPPEAPTAVVAPATPPVPRGDAVTAPIIGVFYRAPSPAASVFVNLGDTVTVGQTLCILEAMKLMNEITAETSGTVTAIFPENGELVTIGQPLFQISP
jgi:acetyl-CoA carboxylase biotin carboxyl carrier protein